MKEELLDAEKLKPKELKGFMISASAKETYKQQKAVYDNKKELTTKKMEYLQKHKETFEAVVKNQWEDIVKSQCRVQNQKSEGVQNQKWVSVNRKKMK